MFSNSNAYQAEVQHRRQQLREDLARRQQAKLVKLARRNRKPLTWPCTMRRSRLRRLAPLDELAADVDYRHVRGVRIP